MIFHFDFLVYATNHIDLVWLGDVKWRNNMVDIRSANVLLSDGNNC